MAHDDHAHEDLQPLLDRLAAGDASAADRLIEHSVGRLQRLAHFMVQGFPHVRRWHETDDVFQAAVLRLRRALQDVKPASPRDFLNLAAVQIRRELYDLARHEYGPEGPGAHHASGPPQPGPDQAGRPAGQERADSTAGPATRAAARDLLRHVAETLPPEEREVFDLLHVLELSQEQAAEQLGVSVPTLKRRWRSVKLKLHRATHSELPRP